MVDVELYRRHERPNAVSLRNRLWLRSHKTQCGGDMWALDCIIPHEMQRLRTGADARRCLEHSCSDVSSHPAVEPSRCWGCEGEATHRRRGHGVGVLLHGGAAARNCLSVARHDAPGPSNVLDISPHHPTGWSLAAPRTVRDWSKTKQRSA
jgi:hypothetical protein